MSNTLIKETQAAIERLMRWCTAKNKEPAAPLEERAFVMDIEMVYTEAAKHFPELCAPVSEERRFEQQDRDIEILEEWYTAELGRWPDYMASLRRLLDRVKRLEQQRGAALKLADKWTAKANDRFKPGDEIYEEQDIRIDEDDCCADELRAIFE